MWAHAEDLDTLEFTLMQVISHLAGTVRISILTPFFSYDVPLDCLADTCF